MNASRISLARKARLWRNLLVGLLAVCLMGAAIAVQATVPVDQQPLIVQKPLSPNIVLVLDDSGSMNWDFMPDYPYIKDNTSLQSLRYSGHNYVYYNPSVLYTPPPHADGTFYPNSPGLGDAFLDGFKNSTPTDITQFTGTFYPYYDQLTSTVNNSYDPVLSCASGDTLLSSGQCQHVVSVTYSWYTLQSNGGSCKAGDQAAPNYSKNGKIECRHATYTYSYYAPDVPSCPYGGTLNSSTNKCVQVAGTTVNLFAYTTLNSSGGYVTNYVGKSQADCQVAINQGFNCDYSAATQQNVANWFSYYRTRIEMARSGVMTAFSGLPAGFRIGFGSINGTNNSELPSPTTVINNKTIAEVQPLGDGSPGTQKAALWNWLVGLSPGGGTPLRITLDAVGKYYETAQPWQTSSTDTTELACRQSYTILTTDGLWNSNTSPNVGNVDGVNGTTVNGPNSTQYTYKAAPPYADSYSNTLADVAMKYWETDLRPTVSNEVGTNAADPAFWQHMTTFTLGIGISPTDIQPSGTTVQQIFNWADGGTPISGFAWPQPVSNTIANIADLAHAAVNGHGGFYSAQSPLGFTIGLQSALQRAAERVGTGSSLASNSSQLKTGVMLYQANYYTVKWIGDLKAYAVDPNTGAIAGTPSWQAAKEMPLWTNRNIYTFNPTAGSSPSTQYVPFKWANLSTAQQTALGNQNVLDYLRGDQSMEQGQNGGIYRVRDTTLGDIVDSQPQYVGAPNPNEFYGETFTGSSTYTAFVDQVKTRTPQVYVAANDGMLHAFNAATGQETWAFVPGAVIKSGLATLSDPSYGSIFTPHQYFNDGQMAIADVYMNAAWHTVLVGSTGRGKAETVYAFDITDPSNIQLLWERSSGDGLTNDGYIGQMTGKPVIAQTGDGTWSVLMGNGYNSPNGVAALLQFDLATGALSVHLTSDTSTSNGMAAPAVWIGDQTNGISTEAYAGDLDGHVWAFPLRSSNGNQATPNSTGTLLFTAVDASNNPQPITAGMLVGQDPTTSDRWLFFGTGRYLSQSDLLDLQVQSWYGIIVDSANSTLVTNLVYGKTDLVNRFIIAQTAGNPTANPPVYPARAITPLPTPSGMSGKSGWFIDLETPLSYSTNGSTYVAEGERITDANQFQGNLLLATTKIPQAKDICNPSGTGWVMAVDPWTGTSPPQNFFDTNGDGLINSADSVNVGGNTFTAAGIGFVSSPNPPTFIGNNMYITTQSSQLSRNRTSGTIGVPGRVSWREITTQ